MRKALLFALVIACIANFWVQWDRYLKLQESTNEDVQVVYVTQDIGAGRTLTMSVWAYRVSPLHSLKMTCQDYTVQTLSNAPREKSKP